MKTAIKVAAVAGMALLFSGCAGSQPQFNPNNKSIKFVEGKAFAIPNGAIYKETTLRKVTKGTGCRIGDVPWVTTNTYKSLSAAKTREEKNIAYTNAKRNGHLGCSSPLSNQEYQYVLNQQNQQQANVRAKKARTAAVYADLNRQTAARNAQTNQMMQNTLNNSSAYSKPDKGYKTYDAYGNLKNSTDCYTTKDAYGRYVKTCK